VAKNGSTLAHFGYVMDNFGNVSAQFGHTKNIRFFVFTPKTKIYGFLKNFMIFMHFVVDFPPA
jgi:ribulose-5-phosphate 4-epimerase/fuculose-1-phosphate aldolase